MNSGFRKLRGVICTTSPLAWIKTESQQWNQLKYESHEGFGSVYFGTQHVPPGIHDATLSK